jgi:hypothetical protein
VISITAGNVAMSAKENPHALEVFATSKHVNPPQARMSRYLWKLTLPTAASADISVAWERYVKMDRVQQELQLSIVMEKALIPTQTPQTVGSVTLSAQKVQPAVAVVV